MRQSTAAAPSPLPPPAAACRRPQLTVPPPAVAFPSCLGLQGVDKYENEVRSRVEGD